MIKIAIAFGVLVTATLLMKKPGMSYRQSVLKTLYPAIMWSSKAAGKKQILTNKNNATAVVSFYSLAATKKARESFNTTPRIDDTEERL